MSEVWIRIFFRASDGTETNGKEDYSPADFGGIIPAIGDQILSPWFKRKGEAHDPSNREVLKVVDRIFKPGAPERNKPEKPKEGVKLVTNIVLIVESRQGEKEDTWIP